MERGISVVILNLDAVVRLVTGNVSGRTAIMGFFSLTTIPIIGVENTSADHCQK
jgi:hypothetical protein